MKWAAEVEVTIDREARWATGPIGVFTVYVYKSGVWEIIRRGKAVDAGDCKDPMIAKRESLASLRWYLLGSLKENIDALTTLEELEEG